MSIYPRNIIMTGLALAMVVLAIGALIIPPARAAGPWYVGPGGSDGNTCLSPATRCATINGALNKPGFVAGDIIRVAIGTYTSASNPRVVLNKNVTVSGGWNAAFTAQNGMSTIDGQKNGLVMSVNSGVTSSVERLVIQNGFVLGLGRGGIDNQGVLALNNVTVSNNTGSGIGNTGVMTLTNVTVRDNIGGQGAGIRNDQTMTLQNSTIIGNRASTDGGGIANVRIMTINNSVIGNNRTGGTGGGIYSSGGSTLTLNNSTVNDNMASQFGGGIASSVFGGDITLNNSTVSGNMVSGTGNGGGIAGYAALTLNNSTISRNTAAGGGGILKGSTGIVVMQNTIVAGNISVLGTSPDCLASAINTSGYNIIGNPAQCNFSPGTGDLINVNAHLGDLIGFPGYQPLLSGSPAINAGNPSGCSGSTEPLTTDQRGAARVGRCDIGAYEYTTPGSAAGILAMGGLPQRTPPFLAFPASLQAAVVDSLGSPISGVIVTFSAPASGVSGTFADSGTSTTTAVTNESGVANAAMFTANGLPGSYTISATAAGIVTPANFQMGNIGWYVTPTGNDTNDCQTPATTCATINGALGKAGFFAGDTILVAEGTYTGNPDNDVVVLDKTVHLLGGWNGTFSNQSGTSIINVQASSRGITVSPAVTAIIEHFTIQNGLATLTGGGIYNWGILTLNNTTIKNITITSELLEDGGGITNEAPGTLILNNSTIKGNTSQPSGGILNAGLLTLNSSTVSGNNAVGILNYGHVNLNSSTISDNRGGGINNVSNTLQGLKMILRNSIVAGNNRELAQDCVGEIVSWDYNLIGDTTDCTFTPAVGDLTNIESGLGPFVDFLGYYPLLPGSPAINAGNPAGCSDQLGNILATDQRGVARVGRCDIGAYEYIAPGPPARIIAVGGTPQRSPISLEFWLPLSILVLDNVDTPLPNITVTFAAPTNGPGGTFKDGTSTTTTATTVAGVATSTTFIANNTIGSYTVMATVNGVSTPANFMLTNMTGWYVKSGGNNVNDCQTPVTACATVNGVLEKTGFLAGDTVLVANGTYVGSGNTVVLLDKNTRLLGGWNDLFTAQSGTSTIDGQDSRHGIYVNAYVTALVAKVNVKNGLGLTQGVGGGIRNDGTLTLNNATVSNNIAYSSGGGLYNRGILTLNNCTVSSNASGQAGGIYNYTPGILTLNNTTVSGNVATGAGGAIRNDGILALNNTVISGNNASQGGGLFNRTILTLNRSTIHGNTASSGGGGIYNSDLFSIITLINSTVSVNSTPEEGSRRKINIQLCSIIHN